MARIVDTSVAVKWVAIEPGWEQARLVREDVLIAPDLLRAELAQALYKRRGLANSARRRRCWRRRKSRRSSCSYRYCRWTRARSSSALSWIIPPETTLFVALAEATGLAIVTADLRLVDRCRTTIYQPLVQLL